MKEHLKLGAASALILLSACATGPSKEDLEKDEKFFERVGACGEGKTISRTVLGYNGKYFDFQGKICYIKVCDEGGKMFVVSGIKIDETECKVEFEGKGGEE